MAAIFLALESMIASFMTKIISRGEFRVTWGTVCHQDAFASMLVGLSTHLKAPVARTRGAPSWHERFYPTPPKPQAMT
jgi:hypothetical protein